ncbi:MAG: hypothetical protein AAFR90_12870, partial [Pseudomonadota bacterium]
AHDDQREAGFSDDYERFERFFIYEGFDRDVARNIAFQLANTKWQMFDQAARFDMSGLGILCHVASHDHIHMAINMLS